jgi:hypothetical protein
MQTAQPGERFASDSFDGQIGRTVPLRVDGSPQEADATVIAAQVSDDGTSVDLTLDIPAAVLPPPDVRPGAFSLG